MDLGDDVDGTVARYEASDVSICTSLLPTAPNPRTLADVGCEVHEGKLCAIDSALPRDALVFVNTTHYRLVQEAMVRHVWALLESELGMSSQTIEGDAIKGRVSAPTTSTATQNCVSSVVVSGAVDLACGLLGSHATSLWTPAPCYRK